jgi:hypothetical protein
MNSAAAAAVKPVIVKPVAAKPAVPGVMHSKEEAALFSAEEALRAASNKKASFEVGSDG